MTYLKGSILLEKGKHRLHGPMWDFTIWSACFGAALAHIGLGQIDLKLPRGFCFYHSAQFHAEIRIFLHGVLERAAKSAIPDEVEVEIVQSQSPLYQPGKVTRKTEGFVTTQELAISPIFVTFFEQYRQWLNSKIGVRQKWPDIWQFGAVVRNAASHGGIIAFDNDKLPPVKWYILEYGFADNGRKVINNDLSIADLVILMFEMSDTLDKLNCPIL